MKKTGSFRKFLLKQLKNPEVATEYLKVAIEEYQEDGQEELFLIALENIGDAILGAGRPHNLKIRQVSFFDTYEYVVFKLSDERGIMVPTSAFPRLYLALSSELENWRIIGNGVGVHWPTLDEDISINTILTLREINEE